MGTPYVVETSGLTKPFGERVAIDGLFWGSLAAARGGVRDDGSGQPTYDRPWERPRRRPSAPLINVTCRTEPVDSVRIVAELTESEPGGSLSGG